MNNILITSGGRRVSLVRAFKKELSKIDINGKIFVSDSQPHLSSAAQIADKAFKICKIEDDNFIDLLLEICIKNEVKLIVPTIDTELLILSKNQHKFLNNNIEIVVSDLSFIETTYSKITTHDFFDTLGVKIAEIYKKDNYQLPLFIKPISGSGSKENYAIINEDQFSKYHFTSDYLQFFEYLDPEYYEEYTCDLYYDKQSELRCVIPRKRIEVRGGEISKGVTVKDEVYSFVKEKFNNIKGARGCITLQVFYHKTNHSIIGIEINPRFGGGFPLSYLARGNYPKWIIEEYLFNKKIENFDDWEDNLLMLRYDNEILVHNYDE